MRAQRLAHPARLSGNRAVHTQFEESIDGRPAPLKLPNKHVPGLQGRRPARSDLLCARDRRQEHRRKHLHTHSDKSLPRGIPWPGHVAASRHPAATELLWRALPWKRCRLRAEDLVRGGLVLVACRTARGHCKAMRCPSRLRTRCGVGLRDKHAYESTQPRTPDGSALSLVSPSLSGLTLCAPSLANLFGPDFTPSVRKSLDSPTPRQEFFQLQMTFNCLVLHPGGPKRLASGPLGRSTRNGRACADDASAGGHAAVRCDAATCGPQSHRAPLSNQHGAKRAL